MAQRRLQGSLALSKLKHVIMTKNGKKDKKGKKTKVRGIFIPFDVNFIEEKDGAVYMSVSAIVKDEEDKYGQHGFISQSTPSKLWKEAKKKEKELMKKLPILGSIKDFEFSGTSNDKAGSAGEVDENDDLPF